MHFDYATIDRLQQSGRLSRAGGNLKALALRFPIKLGMMNRQNLLSILRCIWKILTFTIDRLQRTVVISTEAQRNGEIFELC